MKKHELVQMIVEGMKERERKVSQEAVKDFLAVLEETVDAVVAHQDEVFIAGMKIATKEVAARTFTNNFGSNAGQVVEAPAKIVPTVKFLGSKKDQLSREI